MVIYIPPEFEPHLRIDYTRVKVIHMNSESRCSTIQKEHVIQCALTATAI